MKLILSLLLPQLSGIVGSFFTIQAIPSWYNNLIKPSFAPPNWVFGPVWLTLYLLMGISVYLNWIKKGKQAKFNVELFFVHLLFNFAWTPIFFGLKNLGFAFFIILMIWLMIVAMIIEFWKVNKISSLLLVPYLAWVTLASALNFLIWRINL